MNITIETTTSNNGVVGGEDTKKAVEHSLKNIVEGTNANRIAKAVESTTTPAATTTPTPTSNTLEISVHAEVTSYL
jgi:hypothetical protein